MGRRDRGVREPSVLEDTASATEATPLIRSAASSPWPPSNGTSPSSEIYRDVASEDGGGDGGGGNDDGVVPEDDDDEPNQKVGPGRALAIVLSVYLLIFLQASNMSGMTMAQSVIAAELDAYEQASWFTSSFLIAVSSCAPIAGRLASIFSPRPTLLISSLIFAVGSLVTSQAHSFAVFILGRVIAGVGAASVMVLAIILILELTTKRRRGLFIGLVNAGVTTGVSLGAVVFGALISSTGWRALFYFQVPVSVVAGLGVYFSIPASFTSGQGGSAATKKGGDEYSVSEKLKRIDYLGAALLTGTIVLFLYGLSSATIAPLPLGLAAALLLLFVGVEYRVAADPVVPLAVLGSRGALLSCAAQLGLMAARWCVLFYAPVFALAVWGWRPAAAGSVLVPTNLGFGLGGLAVGWLHVRRAGSYWAACLASIALFAVSLLGLGLLSLSSSSSSSLSSSSESSSSSSPSPAFILALFANGLCAGAALNYTLAHVLHLTPPATHYMATSLIGTVRGFAGSFGSAIGGGVFARALRAQLEVGFRRIGGLSDERRAALVRQLLGSPALVYHGDAGDLTSRERAVAVAAYAHAIGVLFVAGVALSALVLVLQAGTGWRAPVLEVEVEEEPGCGEEEGGRRSEERPIR